MNLKRGPFQTGGGERGGKEGMEIRHFFSFLGQYAGGLLLELANSPSGLLMQILSRRKKRKRTETEKAPSLKKRDSRGRERRGRGTKNRGLFSSGKSGEERGRGRCK